MTTRITLIRHGETLWNATGRWQGHAPVPLHDTGIAQAKTAAPHLRNAGINHIVASDLSRAKYTAEIIAETLSLPVTTDPRWREVDLGQWQGLFSTEIMEWDEERRRQFEATDYVDRVFPDGEATRQHIARTVAGLNALLVDYPDEHILVATHGGSIRCAVYHLTGDVISLVGNCSITRLIHEDGTWRVIGIAESADSIAW